MSSRPPDCAHCGGLMPPITAEMRRYAGHLIELDEFCSAPCCRAAHGLTGAVLSTTPRRVPATGEPTRLQQGRLEVSAARLALVRPERVDEAVAA